MGQIRYAPIILPGGSSPKPPFSRFARRAVSGRAFDHCFVLEILTGGTGPKEPATMSSWYKLPVTARRAKRENGAWGRIPQEVR
jgi:hypothetical protein